jgi:hypothetical protein
MDKFNTNNLNNQGIKDINFKHGGNILTQGKKIKFITI